MAVLSQFFDEWGHPKEFEPLGVIDIGSNSVRLIIYDGAVRSATPLFNEKILCGLGRSLATTGKLGKEATDRAVAALARFHAIVRALGVKNTRALATAAVRDAEDGKDFILRAEEIAEVKIEVLSGAREASLAASGIRMGFLDADGIAGDLGGGSLELVDISHDICNEAATLPIGGLRLIDLTGDKVEKAQPLIDQHFAELGWLKTGSGRKFFAVGGTWRALAKMHMESHNYPLRVMHGYALPAPEVIRFCEMVYRAKKVSNLSGISEVSRARREVLPYGALVLARLLKSLNSSEVIFSVFGIREGLVYDFLSEHERTKDPLICFCLDFAKMRSRSVEHAKELCFWTDALFQGEGPSESAEERRLRHAACLLSDIGWRAHPDYRGEQSLNVIAHGGLSGIDHAGRIFLGLSVYYRHDSGDNASDHLSERLRQSVSKKVQKRARIVGSAIRTAHMLSIGRPGVIDECPLSYEDGSLVLTIPRRHAALDGERLRRRFEALAGLVGCAPLVRVEKGGHS